MDAPPSADGRPQKAGGLGGGRSPPIFNFVSSHPTYPMAPTRASRPFLPQELPLSPISLSQNLLPLHTVFPFTLPAPPSPPRLFSPLPQIQKVFFFAAALSPRLDPLPAHSPTFRPRPRSSSLVFNVSFMMLMQGRASRSFQGL